MYLALKVIAASYDSDPDIYISKVNFIDQNLQTNQFPKTTSESDFYCMKKGSDSCVIGPDKISIGETFYLGVKCMDRCQYHLRATWVYMITLSEAAEFQDTLSGYSSDLFRYYVPASAVDGFTSAVKISVTSDSTYNNIDLYLSPSTI